MPDPGRRCRTAGLRERAAVDRQLPGGAEDGIRAADRRRGGRHVRPRMATPVTILRRPVQPHQLCKPRSSSARRATRIDQPASSHGHRFRHQLQLGSGTYTQRCNSISRRAASTRSAVGAVSPSIGPGGPTSSDISFSIRRCARGPGGGQIPGAAPHRTATPERPPPSRLRGRTRRRKPGPAITPFPFAHRRGLWLQQRGVRALCCSTIPPMPRHVPGRGHATRMTSSCHLVTQHPNQGSNAPTLQAHPTKRHKR